jgi:charged multivesicular body protein 3
MAALFGASKKDPVKQAREWKMTIRGEIRNVERQLRELDRADKEAVKNIKAAAKRQDNKSTRILAKELVNLRKVKERLYCGRAHLNSINLLIDSQIANIRVAGCLQQNVAVMEKINETLRLPEFNHTMMTLAREMEKAGLIEEVMADAIDSVTEIDEGEVDAEVEKVMQELAVNFEENAPAIPKSSLVEDNSAKESVLQARMEALGGI